MQRTGAGVEGSLAPKEPALRQFCTPKQLQISAQIPPICVFPYAAATSAEGKSLSLIGPRSLASVGTTELQVKGGCVHLCAWACWVQLLVYRWQQHSGAPAEGNGSMKSNREPCLLSCILRSRVILQNKVQDSVGWRGCFNQALIPIAGCRQRYTSS